MPRDFSDPNLDSSEDREPLSDRLLKASVNATNALLTISPLDEAVNAALKIIGESLDTDRVTVIENFDCLEPLPCWKMLYEWISPDTVSQIAHPEVFQGTYEGIESWYESISQGQGITYSIEDMPEPFRSGQEKLGVKALHIVPIFVENKCWGVVGFDDCREVKHRGQSELSVLKIAANSIGSAIQRDRSQQALLRSQQERAVELEKINKTLNRSLTWLSQEQNLNNFLEQILLEISGTVEADMAHLFVLHSDRMLEVVARVIDGKLVKHHVPSEPDIFATPFSADITPLFSMLAEQNLFIISDITKLTDEFEAAAWPNTIEWHRRTGYKVCACLVLKAGDRDVGFLGLTFNEMVELVEEKRQLVIGLANQAALAITLLQLAEQSKQAALFEERNRLAGEIHDTLAQSFTGISLQLGVAKWLLKAEPVKIEPILDRINDIAQTGLAEARRSIWQIYPTAQEYASLAEKLTEYVEDIKKGTFDLTPQIDLRILGTAYQVAAIIGYNLLKIAQEAITNALKHSKAMNLSIILTYKTSLVSLQITDNGRGFQSSIDNGGFGLISMSERSDRLGGQLSINSILGSGTEVIVEIPLEERL